MQSIDRYRLLAAVAMAAATAGCGGSSRGGAPPGDAGADSTGADGSADAGTCRTDVQHRATAAMCASHADAGVIMDPTTCGQKLVPNDACLGDGDCAGAHGTSGVCECQTPHGSGCGAPLVTGNACVPSSCRVDSDCPTCGLCRVEQSCGVVTGYYCESLADECSSNADCGSGFCTFQGDRFACDHTAACAQ
jgi:hypothetical protein